ncbi:hypothetical protein [Nocardiopsis oceani]
MTHQKAPPTTAEPGPTTRTRLFFVDNLRVVLTLLVVLHHAAITYGNIPAWYYTEPAQDPTGVVLDLFVLLNQTFSITPGAIQSSPPWQRWPCP